MSVQRSQRFTRDNPCPVCRGYERAARGQGKRCHGFRSADGTFAFCTREEWSGDALRYDSDAQAWVHDLRRAPATERGGYATRNGEHLRVPPPAQPRENPTVYDYRDAAGVLRFQVVRYPDKRFAQRRPDGKGGVIYNLDGVERVLYRLPELLASGQGDAETPVYLVEGEKDVATLQALGLVATTNPGGAGKWRAEYNGSLAGRQVVIVPDNDVPGWEHALAVARSLAPVAACVKVVTLPDVAEKGDVTDWLNGGGSLDALVALAEAEECWEVPDDDLLAATLGENEKVSNQFAFTTVDDLLGEPEEEVAYVWDQTLPRGGISICAAKPKVGKSTLVRSLIHAVSRGEPFFGRATAAGPILYLCLEEKRGEVRRQARAMGLAGDRVLIHTGSAPAEPLAALSEEIAAVRPILVVIDPLAWFIRVAELNSYGEVTRAMEPLNDLARSSHAHILCVHHLGKGERGGGDSLLGSTALFGAVDTLLIMKRREQVRTVETIQRYGTDLPATVARFDPFTYRVSAGENLLALQLAEAEARVLEAVEGDSLTETEIREQCASDAVFTQRAIRSLTGRGALQREGTGKRGDPFRYALPRMDDVPA